MQNRKTHTATYGPWLVGLGAALWGTESAWRIPLNELFDAKVIVFWEHVFILIMGTGYALICALFWGLSTVAGRGVMVGMSLRLASSMRIVIGLGCMTLILSAYGKLNGAALWPGPAQAHAIKAIMLLFLLASISGGIPLLI